MKAGPSESDVAALEWTADDRGLVSGMRYHDGVLASLEIGRGRVRVSVAPVGGGLTVFDLIGDATFGSIGLMSGDIVLDVWSFRIGPDAVGSPAFAGLVAALHGDTLRDNEIEAAARRICTQNVGRLLVGFTCARSSEFTILADDMRVTKAGY